MRELVGLVAHKVVVSIIDGELTVKDVINSPYIMAHKETDNRIKSIKEMRVELKKKIQNYDILDGEEWRFDKVYKELKDDELTPVKREKKNVRQRKKAYFNFSED